MANTAGRRERRSAESRVGETYGSLTVTAVWRDKEKKTGRCTAKCEHSGIEKEYRLSSLVRGVTTSCGCLSSSSKRRSAESHVGQSINNMTLLKVVGKNSNGDAIGRFRCEHCGSDHKESLIHSWKINSLRSCGCKKKTTQTKAEDHIGVQYNHLTLIKVTGKDKHESKTGLYQCSNCGNEKDGIRISSVATDVVKSCGCLQNKAEEQIETIWGNLKLLKVIQKKNNIDINQTKGIFECLLCNSHKEIDVNPVKRGLQTDCGCSKHHGYTYHKSFKVYKAMIRRCTNPLRKDYPQYGGRGVTVCARWMEPDGAGLRNFMADVGDARPNKKHSLHRMWKYNDDGRLIEMMEYGPDTCKWATSRQQAIERTEPRYRARVELMLKMADEGKTVEEMAEALNKSVNKIEFYLARCGLIKDYTYTEDGEVIKKTKRIEQES